MDKRTMRLGDYDTAAHGLWTLSAWDFPAPEVQTNLVSIPGRAKGPLDLSTVLTDGVPLYGARELTATLESSEGDRLARKGRIAELVRKLHGQRVDIVLPDHPDHYATGRLSVRQLYNDPAHAAVQIIGTCEPWLYAKAETIVRLTATTAEQTALLRNVGSMPVVPSVKIEAASGSSVSLGFDNSRVSVSAGTYKWPALLLTPGDHVLTYSGSGTVTITYREAVLW